MAGDAAYGREPCEFCGKMLAANDHWAKKTAFRFLLRAATGTAKLRATTEPVAPWVAHAAVAPAH